MCCEIVRTTEKALLWWLQMYFCPAMGGFLPVVRFYGMCWAHELFSCGRKQTIASLIRQLLYFSPAFPASKVVDFVHLILQAFCGILYIEAFCIQILHVAFFAGRREKYVCSGRQCALRCGRCLYDHGARDAGLFRQYAGVLHIFSYSVLRISQSFS